MGGWGWDGTGLGQWENTDEINESEAAAVAVAVAAATDSLNGTSPSSIFSNQSFSFSSKPKKQNKTSFRFVSFQ